MAWSIHEMAHFWAFSGPKSPKCDLILLKFAPVITQGEQDTVSRIFLKIQIFTEKGRSQSLHFFLVFVQLWGRFCPWRRPKSKKLNISRTKLCHRAIQKLQIQGPILCQFFRKNTITFCPILAVFWWKKGRGQVLKARNQNVIYPIAVSQFWGMFQYKKFGSSTSQFCGYRYQRLFFFKFQTTFSSLAAFLGTTPLI